MFLNLLPFLVLMKKKCLVCRAEAFYLMKNTANFYCQDCAEENFADLEMLVKIEDEEVKEQIEKVLNPEDEL